MFDFGYGFGSSINNLMVKQFKVTNILLEVREVVLSLSKFCSINIMNIAKNQDIELVLYSICEIDV